VDEIKNEYKVGDLVKYRQPRRFFSDNIQENMIGVVTGTDLYFAKVLWQDALWCLESFEDIIKYEIVLNETKGK